jgi:hypothetical protein
MRLARVAAYQRERRPLPFSPARIRPRRLRPRGERHDPAAGVGGHDAEARAEGEAARRSSRRLIAPRGAALFAFHRRHGQEMAGNYRSQIVAWAGRLLPRAGRGGILTR